MSTVYVTEPDADGVLRAGVDHHEVSEELHVTLAEAIELRNKLTRTINRLAADVGEEV
ncbi:hypothetical protein GKE82_05835 [Conexibacter sp. W3-3-2]|uniref:hypothetical protein n=1 Tax=Conexibacter sp. W3-3-2 TaxID=2675227 RepID=UPI0012B6F5DB|nr:hypothetical protein [Conexibacter sp. W3-3-2]MTD43836.1 hypothetical protein [Conexibacter sp. W3-3-2]